jgi:hypothetical protein
MSSESFENLSYEDRTFTPSQSFIDNANTKSNVYDEGIKLLIGNYPLLNGLLVEN